MHTVCGALGYRVAGLTVSLLLPNNALTLPVQELQVICHHPLLAFMDDFAVGAWVQVLPTSHLFIFQPSQNLREEKCGDTCLILSFVLVI